MERLLSWIVCTAQVIEIALKWLPTHHGKLGFVKKEQGSGR
ncbi:hypothetical protein COLO4_37560 [Corchorus olitorius]|uniref:Uncharacterized protein n=1 Tax=Corchorus olitorius TaxID=93759 RepID=A0A1R3G0T0_9ROSI|nr:hypothetical protein COLO4_37560 [Corchorus olitorius]